VKAVFLNSARKDKVAALEEEISSRGIKINRADNLFFDSRFSKGHQGIAALVAPRGYADFDELLEAPSRNNESPLFLLLDGVEDPGISERSSGSRTQEGSMELSSRRTGLHLSALKLSRPQQAPPNTFLSLWCRTLKTLSGR